MASEFKDPEYVSVWAAIASFGESLGIREESIAERTKLSAGTVMCICKALVAHGFVTFAPRQTGTAGTMSDFYTPVPGVKIVAPK